MGEVHTMQRGERMAGPSFGLDHDISCIAFNNFSTHFQMRFVST